MSLIDRIAVDLTDPDNLAWTREELEAWADEALGMVLSLDPKLFATKKVVEIEPCTEVHQPGCCDFVFSVIGLATKEGRVTKRLRRMESWGNPWPLSTNCRRKNRGPSRYYIEGRNNILIAPEVPAGSEAYLLVECASKDDIDKDNLPPGVDAAVVQWVLYRARNKDAESSVVADLGEANYAKMKDILAMVRTGEKVDG